MNLIDWIFLNVPARVASEVIVQLTLVGIPMAIAWIWKGWRAALFIAIPIVAGQLVGGAIRKWRNRK